MGSSFEQVIRVSASAYSKGRALLPKKLANEAINHFKDNWRKQGFDDNTVKPWKPRKGQIRTGISRVAKETGYGRAILVKTGRLRRSFYQVQESINKVYVINDTPYSIYHNYGTRKMVQRKFMGKSRNLDEKSGVLIMRMIKSSFK
jgi:phage gpG-like protein